MSSAQQYTNRFISWLCEPVSNYALISFRIIFGLLLCIHVASALVSGAVFHNYIEPPFTFNYIGFDFLQPLPGYGMYAYFIFMFMLAAMIMAGAWYRLAITTFSMMWTILYLMQKANYNNHYYLMLLLCWIMVFMPANRLYSVDVKRKVVTETYYCQRRCIFLFIAQLAIVYFFAAISKIDSDWFSGKYLAIQFSGQSQRFISGYFYRQEWFRLFICYGGFLFDLLIVPLLLWKKTRNAAFIAACLFHLFNAYTFRIGIFPFLSIALLLFFFEQSFIQRKFFALSSKQIAAELPVSGFRNVSLIASGIYILFQLLIPMRSWLFPGNVYWTEEGYRMSWKMMMRTKSGSVYFKVVNPAKKEIWKIEPAKIFKPDKILWLSTSPDIIWQYAQRINKEYQQKGIKNVEVYAIGQVRLNRSHPKPMVDSTVNLAAVKWEAFRHSEWLTREP